MPYLLAPVLPARCLALTLATSVQPNGCFALLSYLGGLSLTRIDGKRGTAFW